MLMTAKRPAPMTRRSSFSFYGHNAEPLHLVTAIIAGIVVVASVKPLSETDLFWHVPLGQQIISTGHVHGAGSGWTILPGIGHWTSSEWLSEVVLAATRNSFGWGGILWLRLLLGLILVGLVARLTLRSTARVSALLMAAIGLPLTAGIQERPQLVSFIFLCPVAVWTKRILDGGKPPRLIFALPLVFVWAQLHELWLLFPAALLLGAGCRALDLKSHRVASLRPTAVTAFALIVVGCVNPVGPRALLLPFTLRSVTSHIAEWQPTPPLDLLVWGLMLAVGLTIWIWTRSNERIPTSEIVFVAAAFGFSLMAFRNVVPAMLLLIPVIGARMSTTRWATGQQATAREGLILFVAAISAASGLALYGAAKTASSPTFSTSVPIAIASDLASDGKIHRVFNAYNASGALVAFGGPGIRLTVDGRADRWGPTYLDNYFNAMALKGDWRGYIKNLDPTDAVLTYGAPIVGELEHDGWHQVMRDHNYVLLRP